MTLLFLLISIGVIWVNLVGLALAARALIRDYAAARVGGLLLFCLALFGAEHFRGLGPHLWFMPISTVLSVWLIWSRRAVLRENLTFEILFGAGALYCLVWRYTFPDIGTFEESFPDLVFIYDYATGVRLPAPDLWMPPLKADCYYGFQFYCAALMGRWFNLAPALCYNLGYCVMTGMITASVFAAARRLCAWRPGAWVVTAALALGGCGLGFVVHLAMKSYIQPLEMARYLGMVWNPVYRTDVGRFLDAHMYTPGVRPAELPVEPLSFVIAKGEFHPPLMGFLVLVFALLAVASLVREEDPRQRRVLHALLAATIPLALVGNTWVFPLQTALVLAWFGYRAAVGERAHLLAGLLGAGGATLLAYPFLATFLVQPSVHMTSIALTRPQDRATPVEWLSVFWPVAVLIVLAPFARERRGLSVFFACLWGVLLAATELFYNHDINSGTWERFNSTLKWWGWIYAGAVLTLGSLNLSSASRLCRYGSLAAVLLPCIQVYDYARMYVQAAKPSVGRMEGSYWLTRDPAVNRIVVSLTAKPGGIAIDSGNRFDNTDAAVLPIYAGKADLMGWPVQEGIWRGFRPEIRERIAQVDDFYANRMADPLAWLLENDVRYVLWLQKDNDDRNGRFKPIGDKISPRYAWRMFAGTGGDWAVGYWERTDPPATR